MWFLKREIKRYFKREKELKGQKIDFGPKANLNYYRVGRVLGRGAFGKVNLALHKLTKKLCCVKSINKNFNK
jgi:serine/threonine protein kinase